MLGAEIPENPWSDCGGKEFDCGLRELSISLSNKSVDKKEAVRPLSVMCIRLVRGREYCLSIPSG